MEIWRKEILIRLREKWVGIGTLMEKGAKGGTRQLWLLWPSPRTPGRARSEIPCGSHQFQPARSQPCLFSCCLFPLLKQRCCSPSPPPHHWSLWSPCCNSPLLAISRFLLSLRYIIFFCPWRNIIAVVTVQHLFHFYYHKCHSYTVNTRSATTLLWIYFSTVFGDISHLKRRNTENICIYIFICMYVCQRDQLLGWLKQCRSTDVHSSSSIYTIRVPGWT